MEFGKIDWGRFKKDDGQGGGEKVRYDCFTNERAAIGQGAPLLHQARTAAAWGGVYPNISSVLKVSALNL